MRYLKLLRNRTNVKFEIVMEYSVKRMPDFGAEPDSYE